MRKMAAEREEEDFKKSETDTVAIINKKNREKQKLNDMKNSLLNRKKQRENISNQYKRKDCAPVNLFDSGYLNKKVKNENIQTEEVKSKQDDLKKEEYKPFGHNKAELLKNLEESILKKSTEIDQIFINKKQKNEVNLNEKDPIFGILPIDENLVLNLIQQSNSKINLNDSRRYTLNEIDI